MINVFFDGFDDVENFNFLSNDLFFGVDLEFNLGFFDFSFDFDLINFVGVMEGFVIKIIVIV